MSVLDVRADQFTAYEPLPALPGAERAESLIAGFSGARGLR
jgi:hypothetical protein